MSNPPPKVPARLKILEAITNNERRYPPSIRELCKTADIASTSTVTYHIQQLINMGYLEKEKGIARGIFPTGKQIDHKDFEKKGGRHANTSTDLRQG